MGSHAGGGPGAKKEKVQDPPVEHDLLVTLEDICKGVTKRMKISRRVVGNDGSVRKEEKVFASIRLDFYNLHVFSHACFVCPQVLTINVKPGWKSGTRITFQREGDQAPNKIPADIVFIIRDKPHALFRREGSDLKYTAKVSLKEVGTTAIFLFLFFMNSRKKMEEIIYIFISFLHPNCQTAPSPRRLGLTTIFTQIAFPTLHFQFVRWQIGFHLRRTSRIEVVLLSWHHVYRAT